MIESIRRWSGSAVSVIEMTINNNSMQVSYIDY